MDKAKLPRSVADSFVFFTQNLNFNDYEMMKVFIEGHEDHGIDGECIRGFAYENPLTVMKALVDGYEVEQTPEDKVREYYDKMQYLRFDLQDHGSEIIKTVLNLLNIKIDGVNVNE